MKTAEERLASRYWDLLDFYPKRYREERGPELVGTLLDGARPGQTRPSGREARSLILEGLRVRAGTGGHRSRRTTLAQGIQVGLLILLAGSLSGRITDVLGARGLGDVRPITAGWSVLFGLAVLAMVIPFGLLALGRVRLALPFVVVGGAAHMVGFPWLYRTGWSDHPPPPDEGPGLLPLHINPDVAAVLIGAALLLVWLRPPAIGLPGLAAAVLPPLFVYAPDWLENAGVLPDAFDEAVWPVLMALALVTYIGLIAYAVVDARPAIALVVLLSVLVSGGVVAALKVGVGGNGIPLSSLVFVLVPILPVVIAAWLGTRRQARLPTPGAPA